MKIGMIGLGRMGADMARRLLKNAHEVVVYDSRRGSILEIEAEGAIPSFSLQEMVSKLDKPKVVWVMLPAGGVTGECIKELKGLLSKDDIIVDGANTYYKDDIQRGEELKKAGIKYVDAGVSGGIWGLKEGYSVMIGGDKKDFDAIEPVIKSLAPDKGYLYCGGTGAGHFVKMVHNGIEYAMMEAYGEGFEILNASPYGKDIENDKVAGVWNNGSVIRSWLLGLLETAFKKDKNLSEIQGYVEDSGEARWTVKEAADLGTAADVIAASLFKRFNSRQKDVFANKVTAALRREFGGHSAVKKGEDVRSGGTGAGGAGHSKPDKK